MASELTFADTQVEELKARFALGKAQGVISFVDGFQTIEERKALYRLAQKTIGLTEYPDLDSLILIVKAGIADLLAAADLARTEGETEAAAALTDSANAFSYNLSADLAECWPGDSVPRTTRHFEEGLKAADDCIRWRTELKKGAWSFSIAWWAKGAHELSLGRAADAVQSFRECRRYSETVLADKEEKKFSNADFGCILANGYLGLAMNASGEPTGSALFQQACADFTSLIPAGGEIGDDAKFGLDQIMRMQRRIMARNEGK